MAAASQVSINLNTSLSSTELRGRSLDPVFAVFIGVSAAAMRINREEKEKGRSTQDSIDSLKRRTQLVFGSSEGKKSGS